MAVSDESSERGPRIGRLVQKDRKEWATFELHVSEDSLEIGGWQVMQRWEAPIMRTMAAIVAGSQGDVLEVGFGLGISASYIQSFRPRTHIIIEAHPDVARRARQWRQNQRGAITIVEGYWEEVAPNIAGPFAGILFDPFPQFTEGDLVKARPYYEYVSNFFPLAAMLLREKGCFTYWSHEPTELAPRHCALLRQYFRAVYLHLVDNLKPPADCSYWSHDSIVVPDATL